MRLHYVYPYPHVDEVIPLMAEGRILPYLDIPFQHGSPRILRLMKRPAHAENTLERIRRWRGEVPQLTLRSTFIVGFPGETEQDFEATLRLVEEIGFDGSFNFLYSPRPGTPAAELPGAVPREIAQARFERLQSVLDRLYRENSERMVGTRQRVLVEGRSLKDERELTGRVDNNRIANFAGPAERVGQFVEVLITAALPHSLRAEVAPQ